MPDCCNPMITRRCAGSIELCSARCGYAKMYSTICDTREDVQPVCNFHTLAAILATGLHERVPNTSACLYIYIYIYIYCCIYRRMSMDVCVTSISIRIYLYMQTLRACKLHTSNNIPERLYLVGMLQTQYRRPTLQRRLRRRHGYKRGRVCYVPKTSLKDIQATAYNIEDSKDIIGCAVCDAHIQEDFQCEDIWKDILNIRRHNVYDVLLHARHYKKTLSIQRNAYTCIYLDLQRERCICVGCLCLQRERIYIYTNYMLLLVLEVTGGILLDKMIKLFSIFAKVAKLTRNCANAAAMRRHCNKGMISKEDRRNGMLCSECLLELFGRNHAIDTHRKHLQWDRGIGGMDSRWVRIGFAPSLGVTWIHLD